MILFFDTETTGLPKNWKAPVTDLDNWPRLVQLAYLVYDFDGNLIHSCNEIVKPNGFTIPLDASNVHGITTDIANQRGSKIEEVFELFSIHLKRAKVIVAHNMAYDEKIIGSEMIRLGLENILDSKEKICTMESTVDLCKFDGPYGYKWPKLEELHRFLFNHDFEGAHDALADIQATAKCFWELKNKKLIKIDNINEIQNNSNENKLNTIESNEILNILKSVISLEKTIKITYRNFNNEVSERILINVKFSLEVLDENEIKLYDIDDSYITGFCTLRNEKRTFKIARIINIDILAPKDLTKFKNDNIVPVKNLLGETSWKLFSTTKFQEIEIFQFFSDLGEFVDLNNIREWENYFPFDYSGGTLLSEWEGWELKYNSALNISQINKYSLHFQGKERKSFIRLISSFHKDVDEDDDVYFAGYRFIELNNSFSVIVRLDTIPPDDWDDLGQTYLRTVCFIDYFGNLYWENGDRQFNRIENKKVVDLNFNKLITKFDFVVIGNQMWMTKNLNVDQFRNGDQIFESRNNEDWKKAGEEGKPAWCYYDNNPENGKIYGKLYNWHAVNDPRGLAPEGWFIPSDNEWNNLIAFLGKYEFFHKLRSENAWEYQFNSTNETGFTALPGGGRDANGVFSYFDCGFIKEIEEEYFEFRNEIGSDAYWWSSTLDSNSNVSCFEISGQLQGIYKTDKGKGYSVRCLNHNFIKAEFIKIGNQQWMPENLNVEHFRNGDRIPEARTNEEWENAGKLKLPAWCNPNKDSSLDKLYNWYAVNDPRGLAPLGVKVPHNSDWQTLVNFLGGKELAGRKMQLYGYNPELDIFEINDDGLGAISGYSRSEFGHCNSSGYIVFWSSTQKSIKEAGYLSIQKDGSKVRLDNTKKSTGYSIRCLME
jgi:uncharacterized protein (TIGR02145 family)